MARRTLYLAAILSLAIPILPAGASTASACLSAITWTFSPPLTTEFTSGTVSMEHTSICTSSSGELPAVQGAGGADIATYTGSCLTALVSSVHYNAAIFASTGVIQLYRDPTTRAGTTVTVGTADEICNVSRLSGLAVGALVQ